MQIGVWIPNRRHLATPENIRGAAVRAKKLGYDETIFEHLVLEFFAADGRELDEQMTAFAERVRPRLD